MDFRELVFDLAVFADRQLQVDFRRFVGRQRECEKRVARGEYQRRLYSFADRAVEGFV